LAPTVSIALQRVVLEIGKPVASGEFLPAPVMDKEEQRLQGIVKKYGQKWFAPDGFAF
jgi:hypothetical protein